MWAAVVGLCVPGGCGPVVCASFFVGAARLSVMDYANCADNLLWATMGGNCLVRYVRMWHMTSTADINSRSHLSMSANAGVLACGFDKEVFDGIPSVFRSGFFLG